MRSGPPATLRHCRSCWKQFQPCPAGAEGFRFECDQHERLGDWIDRQRARVERMRRASRSYAWAIAGFVVLLLVLAAVGPG